MLKGKTQVEVSKEEMVRLAHFRSSLRHFLRFSELQARAAGITPQQHQMLLAVKGFSPERDWVTVGEVAESLQVAHNAAVGLVQRAEASGLVTRSVHPDDRRAICVALTPQGEAVLAALTVEHKRELGRILPVLTDLLAGIAYELDRHAGVAAD